MDRNDVVVYLRMESLLDRTGWAMPGVRQHHTGSLALPALMFWLSEKELTHGHV